MFSLIKISLYSNNFKNEIPDIYKMLWQGKAYTPELAKKAREAKENIK